MLPCTEAFADNLKAKDLRFQVDSLDNGDEVLRIGFSGRITNFYFSADDGGAHVAIRTLIEKCAEDKIPDMLVLCNQLNMEYRWLKFYLDNDNDIMVADDAVLSPETAGEECFELLVRTQRIINDVKPRIMRVLYA